MELYYCIHHESSCAFILDSVEELDKVLNDGCEWYTNRSDWMRICKLHDIEDIDYNIIKNNKNKENTLAEDIMDFDAMFEEQEQKAISGEAFKEKSKYESDERFYNISKDSKGNGKVKIRFIPSLNADQTKLGMHITRQMHNVNWYKVFGDDKSEKRWWSGICPKTVDAKTPCPICDYGFKMGKTIEKRTGKEAETDPEQLLRKSYYKEFCSKDNIITNIMILKDEINPANEGKIFLFEMSNTVFKMFAKEQEKIADTLSECEDEDARTARNIPLDLKGFNPYDLINGKDFWLIFKGKKGGDWKVADDYWGHSRWDDIFTSKVSTKEERIEIIKKAHCLDEFTSIENMPTQEFLEEKIEHLTFQTKSEDSEAKTSTSTETKSAPDTANISDEDDILAQIQADAETVTEEPKQEEKPKEEKVADKPKEEVKKVETKASSKVDVEEDDDDAFLAGILGD